MEPEAKTHTKGRSQEQKVGKIKYQTQLLIRALRELEEMKIDIRSIKKGFAGSGLLHYGKSGIEKIVCADEVDVQILQLLYQAGGAGMFPKDIAAALSFYKLTRFHVTRRLERMNKRLDKDKKTGIGERVAERRGWHWALTSFAYEIWNETEIDGVGKVEKVEEVEDSQAVI